jgi:hypothetical protein
MILPVLISLGIIILTIFIHGYGTIRWVLYVGEKFSGNVQKWSFSTAMYTVSYTACILTILHFIEIAIWAAVYLIIPDIKNLQNVEEAIYFSLITYTTVGYGDITLVSRWRIMCGFEAMNGILLFGWSTSLFFTMSVKVIRHLEDFKSLLSRSE